MKGIEGEIMIFKLISIFLLIRNIKEIYIKFHDTKNWTIQLERQIDRFEMIPNSLRR